MKKTFLVLLMLAGVMQLGAQDKPKAVTSKIRSVTVFLSGAQITQTADASLSQGQSEIMFEDLTANLDPQSIQVKGEGNFTILSVVHQINYLKSQEKPAEVVRIEDSLQILQRDLDYQKSLLAVYQQEEAMLIANKEIGGDDAGVKVMELKEATEYFRVRLTDILNNKVAVGTKIRKIEARMGILSNQLTALNARKPQPTSEIVITVNADAVVSGKFTLSYYVYDAGWTPTYDLRAKDVNNPIDLYFRANVHQNTGADWKNVNLTLSTGNPTQHGTRPVLNPWYVSFYTPYTYKWDADKRAAPSSAAETEKPMREETKEEGDIAGGIADYTVVSEQQTTVEFEIGIPYSVPSDGKNYMVEIQKHNLPAIYEYYCAPKIDPDAYLMARVTGWEQYNLLSGEVNLFFEGTYVGKSYINTAVTTDTLDFSLGKDKNIVVKREQLADFSSTKLIGLNKKETYTYEISLRNKKKSGITLLLEDQLPLTTDKEIEIEALEISGATHNTDNGKLSWRISMKTGEEKKIRLSYSIKYPKDKTIQK